MGNVKSFCCKDNVSEIDDQEERSRILPENCEEFYSNNSNISNPSQDNTSYGSMNSDGNGSRSMEQSILDKIYQKMASNVIDVAPGDSIVIQQAEFIERQKAYQSKLSQLKIALPLKMAHHQNNPNYQHHSRQTLKNVGNSFETRLPTSSPSSASTNSTSLAALHNTCPNFSTSGSGFHLSPNTVTIMNNTTLNRLQDKRRVEYEPISPDEIQLIKEVSSKSVNAIKNLRIDTEEQVVTLFKP